LSSTQLVVRGSRLVCFLSLVLRIDHSAPGANAVNSNGAWLQKSLLLLALTLHSLKNEGPAVVLQVLWKWKIQSC